MGIRSQYVQVSDARQFIEAVNNSRNGIIIDVASVSKVVAENHLDGFDTVLHQCDSPVLLFVSDSDQLADRFIEVATDGAVRGTEILTNCGSTTFCKSSSSAVIELPGYSYRRGRSDGLGLMVNSLTNGRVVMQLNETPAFIQIQIGRTNVFVWATLDVFDMHCLLSAETEFEEAVDEYIPAIIFLRSTFGDRCWHNPNPGAGIVIDDPLLQRRYGLLDFRKLLDSAKKNQYQITLAFIPWNYWRSRVSDAKTFLRYSDCFSVCAHGCDHTNREFRSTDYESLSNKNFVARQRMERLRQKTGIASEPLMVCPQEQYSLEAMRAFADSRQFLGLICTACMPRNLPFPQITGADLLLPAQDSFFGFPVFKRHYSGNMATFAMALFLGKPAILVEHHEFFRNGPGAAETFVEELARIRPDLKWRPLVETVMRTHARRRLSENRWEVRFFTDTFQLEYELEQPIGLKLLRRLPETTSVERVRADGREVPFSREDGFLMFETQLDYPQTLSVKVDCRSVKPTKFYSPGVRYHASVALRRGLSELRDNVIARNPVVLRASKRLVKSFKQTPS